MQPNQGKSYFIINSHLSALYTTAYPPADPNNAQIMHAGNQARMMCIYSINGQVCQGSSNNLQAQFRNCNQTVRSGILHQIAMDFRMS